MVRHATKAIESLALTPAAKAAAYELKRLHPGVVFTSGRRDKAAQAHAMASNVIRNRKWIVQTYKESEVQAACQKWVDEHPRSGHPGTDSGGPAKRVQQSDP